MSQSLRDLGLDFVEDQKWERALGVFAEAVRRQPSDHRARMLAARCYQKMGEAERAVAVLHACAEGLLKRDYLLSAIAACLQALPMAPRERRIRETLTRIHARAARVIGGRAGGPPPLPPESMYDGKTELDLMTLQGSELSDQAISVLGAVDSSATSDPEARPPLPLFADLERDAFVDLVELLDYRELKEGEVICTEGQTTDRIFVLVAGKAEVSRQVEGEAKTLAFLGGGSIFGEISMLTGAAPTSTITAVSACDLLEIQREDLNQIARTYPSVPAVLATFAQQRMARNLIATSPLFAIIPEADRPELLTRFDFKALAAGEKAISEGAPVTGLVLVLAGELVVQKEDGEGGLVSLSILREGDIAGEIALIKGLRATATVAASRKTAVAILGRAAFEALIKQHPKIREYLDGLGDRRLKMIGEAMRPLEILDADELVVEST
ncbi:MAG: cyclic nucleotide-binding domain-containing protein [Archangium sp.]|nr:cyclic nucleotide-binding domain-containing protein [Archangium sp.]MDP3156474.1 cyclic nucleotide-binding domain-containing protein [Archangium sp.]MDP3571665.1 cyclic nucleotide-binding domain-containing protein [Archangium sp.]